MRPEQRLFLTQARSCFEVFQHLKSRTDVPQCHPLHYLQMATELLAKASLWGSGLPPDLSHAVFVNFLRNLKGNLAARKVFGAKKYDGWVKMIEGHTAIAQQIEDLAPAIAEKKQHQINPEYPWPPHAPIHCPATYRFTLWDELTGRAPGRQFLAFLARLFAAADAYL